MGGLPDEKEKKNCWSGNEDENGYDRTSLLFAIQLLTTSGVNSSATTFFCLLLVQAGPLLTTPMLGPNKASSFFFSLSLSFISMTTGGAPGEREAIATAVREVLVSVLAKKGAACKRRVRVHVAYWLLSKPGEKRKVKKRTLSVSLFGSLHQLDRVLVIVGGDVEARMGDGGSLGERNYITLTIKFSSKLSLNQIVTQRN